MSTVSRRWSNDTANSLVLCVYGCLRSQEIRVIRGGRFSNAAYNVGSFARFSDIAEGKGCKPLRVAAMMDSLARTLPSLLQKLLRSPSSECTYNIIASIRGTPQRLHGRPQPPNHASHALADLICLNFFLRLCARRFLCGFLLCRSGAVCCIPNCSRCGLLATASLQRSS